MTGKVLVIGDTILDAFIYGTVSRVNPEASYSTVFDVNGQQNVCLGGAANVAANIKSIYPDAIVHYFGYVSESVSEFLIDRGISFKSELMIPDKDILLKTRFVCDNHYLLRVDQGSRYEELPFEILPEVLKKNSYDLVVVSDYNKGSVTINVLEVFKYGGEKTPKVLIDGKVMNNLCEDKNFILKCNEKEFEEFESYRDRFKAIIKTLGKDGFVVYENGYIDRFNAHEVVRLSDNVGAGDSFLAGMAAHYLRHKLWSPVAMAKFGNICASEKVKNQGTWAVTLKENQKK